MPTSSQAVLQPDHESHFQWMTQQRMIRVNADEVLLFAAQLGSQFQFENMFVGFSMTGELETEMLEIAQPSLLELTADQQFNNHILRLQVIEFGSHPELQSLIELDTFAWGIQAT